MSEQSQGPGWWRASDGRWYPPETHPGYRPPEPPPPLEPPPPPQRQEPQGEPEPASRPRPPAFRPPSRRRQKGSLWQRFRALPRWVQIASWVVFVVIVIAAAASPNPDDKEVTSGTSPTTAEAADPAESDTTVGSTIQTSTTAAGPRSTFGAGTHRVGSDIAPGTYRNSGGSSSTCYWARLSDFGGGVGSIIANNLGGGQQVVTIAPTDAGFESRNCGTWSQA